MEAYKTNCSFPVSVRADNERGAVLDLEAEQSHTSFSFGALDRLKSFEVFLRNVKNNLYQFVLLQNRFELHFSKAGQGEHFFFGHQIQGKRVSSKHDLSHFSQVGCLEVPKTVLLGVNSK
jgi:hypothetical protein